MPGIRLYGQHSLVFIKIDLINVGNFHPNKAIIKRKKR